MKSLSKVEMGRETFLKQWVRANWLVYDEPEGHKLQIEGVYVRCCYCFKSP